MNERYLMIDKAYYRLNSAIEKGGGLKTKKRLHLIAKVKTLFILAASRFGR